MLSRETSRKRNEAAQLKKSPSDYFEYSNMPNRKEEVKTKTKLKDFVTQVDPTQGILSNVTHKGHQKVKTSKTPNSYDRKVTGHGSTGGFESSHELSNTSQQLNNQASDMNHFKKLNQELAKNMHIVDDEVVDLQSYHNNAESDPAIQQEEEETKNQANFSDIHKMHMIQTLQGLLFIRSLEPVQPEIIESKMVFLPPPDDPVKKKVIVFDLDETLVHCLEDFDPNEVDHVLTIEFPNDELVDAGLNIRPYAIECLKEANQHFQVVVFTASHS